MANKIASIQSLTVRYKDNTAAFKNTTYSDSILQADTNHLLLLPYNIPVSEQTYAKHSIIIAYNDLLVKLMFAGRYENNKPQLWELADTMYSDKAQKTVYT